MSTRSPESFSDTPVDRLRDMVAGWIDVVATQGEKTLDSLGRRASGTHWLPNLDIVETEDQVLISVDLPGIDPQKVEILLTGNMLTIKGELPPHVIPAGATTHRHERPTGSFCRSVPLPVAVDSERVSADARLGVLTITLAREERLRPRHIHVSVPAEASGG